MQEVARCPLSQVLLIYPQVREEAQQLLGSLLPRLPREGR